VRSSSPTRTGSGGGGSAGLAFVHVGLHLTGGAWREPARAPHPGQLPADSGQRQRYRMSARPRRLRPPGGHRRQMLHRRHQRVGIGTVARTDQHPLPDTHPDPVLPAVVQYGPADPQGDGSGAGDPPRGLQGLTRLQDRIPGGPLHDLLQSFQGDDGCHGHIQPRRPAAPGLAEWRGPGTSPGPAGLAADNTDVDHNQGLRIVV
jgi:hypothetical protein